MKYDVEAVVWYRRWISVVVVVVMMKEQKEEVA
jgi:hypothetical protein